jgi:hypothetical protein
MSICTFEPLEEFKAAEVRVGVARLTPSGVEFSLDSSTAKVAAQDADLPIGKSFF